MDKLDRAMKLKQFLKTIYADGIIEGNNLNDNQSIRIYQNNKTNNDSENEPLNMIKFFDNIDDVVSHCTERHFGMNTYFNLATTNGESGQAKDLLYRYCLAFDFDKKELGANFDGKDVMHKFNELNLKYHILVDSGHGYHAYVLIETTADHKRVEEVTKAIGARLGADINAMKQTQLLRVPYTFNIKGKSRPVNILKMYDKDTIKRYNIDKLYNRFCCNIKDSVGNKSTEFVLSNSNVPRCIEEILKSGSPDGSKNSDLSKIVVTLRRLNKSITEIEQICREWNDKSGDKFSDHELNYQVHYNYDNRIQCSYDCQGCKYSSECFNSVQSDFTHDDSEVLIMSETHMSRLKTSKRKGAKVMKCNDLLVYSILKCHSDGLTREEILKELTYTKKNEVKNVALSDRVLKDTLKSLAENEFIEVVKGNARAGIENIYKLKECKTKIELTYNISISATQECIKGNISTEELRLYNYMRYLHHKEQRENPKALKGNLCQFNQVDLAKDLGVTQGRVSQMINNLLDERLLGIWYRQQSKNNGFDYNIYRLNY